MLASASSAAVKRKDGNMDNLYKWMDCLVVARCAGRKQECHLFCRSTITLCKVPLRATFGTVIRYQTCKEGYLVSSPELVLRVLRTQLRAAGITYKVLAERIAMSESSVKRMFGQHDMSLSRLA